MAGAGLRFDVQVVDIDEAALIDSSQRDPSVVVERIAQAKFAAFPVDSDQPLLLTADTLVSCDDAIMGKPQSDQHLRDMLVHMSGQPVTVVTAVCVGSRGEAAKTEIVSTTVVLRELRADEIERYVSTGAGRDKAGGLALQAQAKPFISAVTGCWSNVLGLPVCAATALLDSVIALQPVAALECEKQCSVELCGSYDG